MCMACECGIPEVMVELIDEVVGLCLCVDALISEARGVGRDGVQLR